MKISILPAIAMISSLAACEANMIPIPEAPAVARQAFGETFQDHPFDSGPVTVLAEEHGELHSFTLTPCGAAHICGSRRGLAVKKPAYWVVSGAYAGRDFYLSPGGDGWVKRDGAYHPVAWN